MGRLGFAVALSIAGVVGACMAVIAMMAFGCLSLYFYMASITTAALAALTVSMFALIFAILLIFLVSLIPRPTLMSFLPSEFDVLGRFTDAVEAGRNIGDEGRQFLKSNLSTSSLAAFGFGIAMGVSPKLRRAVFSLLKH